jgi:hypothetical protein
MHLTGGVMFDDERLLSALGMLRKGAVGESKAIGLVAHVHKWSGPTRIPRTTFVSASIAAAGGKTSTPASTCARHSRIPCLASSKTLFPKTTL